MLFEDQPIGIETDLKSNFIDLERLFELGFTETGTDGYDFSISPNIHLNFNCDIGRLHYKRFKPTSITGNLLVKNQMAVFRNVHMNGLGGAMNFDGIVNAQHQNAIDVSSQFNVAGIHVDSVFYIFENFKQTFIEDRHLKGQAYADVMMELTLNEN
ncbi:MAG: hypothetical protein HC811_10725 [Flammeovirgaceae bacterium]|nr:hypothetical protein [Flammeovirgaceae bacterium]